MKNLVEPVFTLVGFYWFSNRTLGSFIILSSSFRYSCFYFFPFWVLIERITHTHFGGGDSGEIVVDSVCSFFVLCCSHTTFSKPQHWTLSHSIDCMLATISNEKFHSNSSHKTTIYFTAMTICWFVHYVCAPDAFSSFLCFHFSHAIAYFWSRFALICSNTVKLENLSKKNPHRCAWSITSNWFLAIQQLLTLLISFIKFTILHQLSLKSFSRKIVSFVRCKHLSVFTIHSNALHWAQVKRVYTTTSRSLDVVCVCWAFNCVTVCSINRCSEFSLLLSHQLLLLWLLLLYRISN